VAKDTVFAKILRKEIPATFLHEDADCVVIEDVHPQAPFHALVIPKKPLESLADATAADQALLGRLLLVAREVAEKAGHGKAFRIVSNAGAGAGQSVPHLHIHVLAGRPLEGRLG
jgi:histidine triad (HIT) family protein